MLENNFTQDRLFAIMNHGAYYVKGKSTCIAKWKNEFGSRIGNFHISGREIPSLKYLNFEAWFTHNSCTAYPYPALVDEPHLPK